MNKYINEREIGSPRSNFDVLIQLFSGPVTDGDVGCKTQRDWLVKHGFAGRTNGFNYITDKGIELLIILRIVSYK